MASLSQMIKVVSSSSAETNPIQLYPGHGEVIDDGVGKLKEYMQHRQEREDQVVEALKAAKAGETTTAAE